jgi:DNA processing protein
MSAPVPPEAHLLALAGLPGMGPARLLAVLRAWGPAGAWTRVRRGTAGDRPDVAARLGPRPDEVLAAWVTAAAAVEPVACWERHRAAGVDLTVLGSPDYPAALGDDHEPPALVVSRGALDALDGPCAAVVGTRRCTRTGRELAFELGRDLAAAGVRVVSGLARGIDAAAHRGALVADGAPPVGVIATGPDIVYPPGHADLWQRVATRGVLLGEAPLGTRPAAWRFPARNRIIAALASVVVVVESHARGGALHTVTEALDRDRTVLAVPGSVRNPAAAGTNRLLHDGIGPARDAADVLAALGLATAPPAPGSDPRVRPSPGGARVLDALGWDPCTLDRIAVVTGLAPGALALVVAELERDGWVHRRGGWLERAGRP